MSPENIAQKSSDHVTSHIDCLSRYLCSSRSYLLELLLQSHIDLLQSHRSVTRTCFNHAPPCFNHAPTCFNHTRCCFNYDDEWLHIDLLQSHWSVTWTCFDHALTCFNHTDLLKHFRPAPTFQLGFFLNETQIPYIQLHNIWVNVGGPCPRWRPIGPS